MTGTGGTVAVGPVALSSTARKAINFAGFQSAWFALVLCAAAGMWWAGFAYATAWLAVHVGMLRGHRRVESILLATAVSMGLLADSALVWAHVIAFPERAAVGPLTTPWMLGLWAAFASTIRHSLRWSLSSAPVAALTGAVGGPLAYLAGESLGAISLPLGAASLGAVALVYAVAMPGLRLAVISLER